ncbi:hypothetical protein, partial [Rhodothermus marinus]|uniref:hypothetical protein n=1 Tax=Rhodothermus marinus TaxID=29549 RepID=UPI001FB4A856
EGSASTGDVREGGPVGAARGRQPWTVEIDSNSHVRKLSAKNLTTFTHNRRHWFTKTLSEWQIFGVCCCRSLPKVLEI